MATIDKQSVRNEFDKIKSSFQQLVDSGKVTAETKAVVDALFLLVTIILSIFMEKITKKNSANSSIPPSQTTKDETSNETNNKPASSKKKQQVTQIENTRTIETITRVEVSNCRNCGADLTNIACQCIERRTKIDIVFEKTVEHLDAEIKECPECHVVTKGEFPKDMHGPLQYGSGVKAFVIQLLVSQMLSLKRAGEMVFQLIGQSLSEATMLRFVMSLYLALADWEANAKEQLQSRLDGKETEITMLMVKKIPKASIAKILGVSRSTLLNFICTRGLG